MKKSLFMMAILAIAALTGCQDQTQSQLEFGDVADKATVQGYVYIDKGYVQEGSTYVVKSLPAAGAEVLVKVPYTKYDADAAAGDKFFEGVCDANGFYSIEVPVGQAAITGAKVYTRPIVDKYYDLVNGSIIEKTASYPESSASVEIERGKVYTAANIYMQKDVEGAILTRNQVIKVTGSIKEFYEKKEYYDPEDKDKGYYGVKEQTNPIKAVKLVITLTNSKYAGEEIVYNVNSSSDGSYNLSVNLYDVWDVKDTKVKVETKAYTATITHYYQQWYEDDSEWRYKSQEVSGYYASGSSTKTLSDGDVLLGAYISNIVLPFTPDYNKNTIYGIGKYTIDYVKGVYTYKSTNPLGWAY